MATSKTLTPTNVTIQIPEFTDQPDQRVNSNCIDKEADAINALNSKLSNMISWSNDQYTNTDSTFGFVDTGISTADYVIIGAFCPNNSNNAIRFSNLDNGGNYRMQIVSATTGEVSKSNWTMRVAIWKMARAYVD